VKLLPILRTERALLGIALVAFALRVYVLFACRPHEVSDAGDYRELAANLVEHGTYGRVGNSGWDEGLTFQAYRPPGYPLLRAALMIVAGPSPYPPLWLNVLGEMVALLFLVATARRLLDRRGVLLAACLFAPIVLFTTNLMTESISMGLWSALAWAYVARIGVGAPLRALGIGAVVAIAVLVRPLSIIWIPVLVAQMFFATQRDLRGIAALAAGPLVLVGAWTIRNYELFHAFVWSSTNLGVHNAPDFGISWTRLTELRQTGLNEAQADRALTREVIAAAASAPMHTLQVLGQRVVDLFSVSIDNCWELSFTRSDVLGRSPIGLALVDMSIGLLRVQHVLSLLGVAVAAWRPRLPERSLIVPLLAFVALQCLLSRGDVRFVAPVLPMLCIFAAAVVRRAA
jgi:hypothetical protein